VASDSCFTRYSSAYEVQAPSAEILSSSALPKLKSRLDKLSADVKAQLIEQGFTDDRIKFERKLNMRFDGTDTAIMVLEKEGQGESSFEEEFKKQYKAEFGFLLEEKNIVIDDVKVCTRSIRWTTLSPDGFRGYVILQPRYSIAWDL